MSLKIKSYLIAILCGISVELLSQNKTIDSLQLAVKNAKNDTSKCYYLHKIIEFTIGNNDSVCNQSCRTLIVYCEKNIPNNENNTLILNTYYRYYAEALNTIGYLFQNKKNPERGLEYYKKSLNILVKLDEKKGIATLYNNIAYIYDNQSNNMLAIEYYSKSLSIHESINNKEGIAYTSINIGGIYKKNGNFEKALEFYQKSLKTMRELKNYRGTINALNNVGAVYLKDNKIDEALKCFKEAMFIAKKNDIKESIGLALTYYWLAQTYLKLQNLDFAQDYFNKCIEEFKKNNDLRGLAESYHGLAEVYFRKNDQKKAIEYSALSLKIAKDMGIPQSINKPAHLLYKIYKSQNSPKQALEHYELYITMRDSLSNQESRKATLKTQLKYEYEKKVAADSVKVAEEKKLTTIKLQQDQTQRYFLYGGLGLTALFGIFMFNRFRVTQKQKNIIEEQKLIVEHQKAIVDEKQKEVLDSIHYAKRIQQSLLPTDKYINRILKKYKS
ncbi:MAG: tetratricopeptide repeat protein [Bacteroidota bacterium]|nr:tetratricopeptide repeat protein [Bacteroidota bacterium]